MKYAVFNQDGTFSQSGECPNEAFQLQVSMHQAAGRIVVEGRANAWDRLDVASGSIIPGTPPAPPPEYLQQRKTAYPPVGAQLDMLWHAMDEGAMPKVEPWYSRIKAVKEAFPKTISRDAGSTTEL